MTEKPVTKLHRFIPIIVRFLAVFVLILLASLAGGCAMPPYMTSLEKILEQKGINNRGGYGYRCTAGAHRGASEDFKENTMAALKAAEESSK